MKVYVINGWFPSGKEEIELYSYCTTDKNLVSTRVESMVDYVTGLIEDYSHHDADRHQTYYVNRNEMVRGSIKKLTIDVWVNLDTEGGKEIFQTYNLYHLHTPGLMQELPLPAMQDSYKLMHIEVSEYVNYGDFNNTISDKDNE